MSCQTPHQSVQGYRLEKDVIGEPQGSHPRSFVVFFFQAVFHDLLLTLLLFSYIITLYEKYHQNYRGNFGIPP